MFALIDCNNFFVSCERLFRPDLTTTPVAVLSSNDGCVVARSNEVKALGVPMGAPLFKYKQTFDDNAITQFSANFELYGNISRRITDILTSVTPHIEIYSIDESFLEISTLHINNYREWGNTLRERILRDVGIPVSVGIAPTKTLAKLASEIAKQEPLHQGIFSFLDISEEAMQQTLSTIPIKNIWGIGRRFAPRLKACGVHTALQLAMLRPQRAQQLLSIRGRQTVAELNSISCFPLERVGKKQKSIMRGRTFGEDTNKQHVIEAAIATMTARAAYMLRDENQATLCAQLLIETNRHKPGYRYWRPEVRFHTPTTDTGHLSSTLIQQFAQIYDPRYRYHRINVYLTAMVPDSYLQIDALHREIEAVDTSTSRMKTLDAINARYGRGHLHYASEKLSDSWQPRRNLVSRRYVSEWGELPEARIVQ